MTLRRGSSGDDVRRVQLALKQLGLYLGPVDGAFGGGTESAVKSFQKARGLEADGSVGPITWKRLFPGEQTPVSDMLARPVSYRCLALTGSFETSTSPPDCFSGCTGDFDGQGISFGALQWNFGQGSLQPLLTRMIHQHRSVIESVFHEHLAQLERVLRMPLPEQLAWCKSIQDRRCRVLEPWRGMLRTLGRTDEFRTIQSDEAGAKYLRAIELAQDYGLKTERAVALMFDIIVQNGSISREVRARIFKDFESCADEVARMKAVANRRAEVSKPRFVEDVRSRKLTIAQGAGTVHGVPYDLDEQFGIRLEPFAPPLATGR